MTSTKNAIIAARKCLGGEMESSARLCLQDAVHEYDAGRFGFALAQAVRSLRYSVGILHPEYKRYSEAWKNL